MQPMTSGDGAPAPFATDAELATKLGLIREAMDRAGVAAVRLRQHDWFAWATCGGSNAVLLASETGVAEVLVTPDEAWILTDTIEADRLAAEELPPGFQVHAPGWAQLAEREAFVADAAAGGVIAADRPTGSEVPLPDEMATTRRRLLPAEVERYRALGHGATEAMTETINSVREDASELEVAGIGAAALWRRGIEPALILVAGSERVERFAHPRATERSIGARAMVVFCGRRAGLYANLTRHVLFREPTEEERAHDDAVAKVEVAAWDASRPGATLGEVYDAIVFAYADAGYPGAERGLHQGGITGYRAREAFAAPNHPMTIEPTVALAWNPSLHGMKIEDTVLRHPDRVEVLTVDPAWPTRDVNGRERPSLLVRRD